MGLITGLVFYESDFTNVGERGGVQWNGVPVGWSKRQSGLLWGTSAAQLASTPVIVPPSRPPAGVQNRMGGTFFAMAFLAFTSLTTGV